MFNLLPPPNWKWLGVIRNVVVCCSILLVARSEICLGYTRFYTDLSCLKSFLNWIWRIAEKLRGCIKVENVSSVWTKFVISHWCLFNMSPRKRFGSGGSICNVQEYIWLSFSSQSGILWLCKQPWLWENHISVHRFCNSVVCRSVSLIPKEWPLSQMFSDVFIHACSQGSQSE